MDFLIDEFHAHPRPGKNNFSNLFASRTPLHCLTKWCVWPPSPLICHSCMTQGIAEMWRARMQRPFIWFPKAWTQGLVSILARHMQTLATAPLHYNEYIANTLRDRGRQPSQLILTYWGEVLLIKVKHKATQSGRDEHCTPCKSAGLWQRPYFTSTFLLETSVSSIL